MQKIFVHSSHDTVYQDVLFILGLKNGHLDTRVQCFSGEASGLEVQWILSTEGETKIKAFLAVIITLGGCSWYSFLDGKLSY